MPGLAPERRLFVNRTLNMRSIEAIGYDMDYTLIHYHVEEWERRAYEHARRFLSVRGWPVDDLVFDPATVIRGLALDLERGNLLKATRFGYVIRAAHGTRLLDHRTWRDEYSATSVDLSDPRFVFLNTLFSLSEAALFGQLVDRFDAGQLPEVTSYTGLYRTVNDALEDAHAGGVLKAEIAADPGRFVDADPDIVLALLDQHHAGKKLLLITNSEWAYTDRMMAYAFDAHMPGPMTWRDLFDTVIVAAMKPSFFMNDLPLYRVVDEERGLLEPHHGPIERGAVFAGGCARLVERSLGLAGDQILYVGDHLFGDVHVSKDVLRWRTALILREMETEVLAERAFRPEEQRLEGLMTDKIHLESALAAAQLAEQRGRLGYDAADGPVERTADGHGGASAEIEQLRRQIRDLDDEISPIAARASTLRNAVWGPLMRSGIDKSLFARQVERYADIYTSRVANFLGPGPFARLRAGRSSLPHDVR